MKSTFQLFVEYKLPEITKTKRTERGDLIDFFLERMNSERKKDGRKLYSKSSMAYFLSVYTTEGLYHLRMKCDRAKNFGATFNYYVFPKK